MNDIITINSTEYHDISELVEAINRNIFNFHKVVHKLQQNYKTNKININKLNDDIKNSTEMIFNLDKNIDNKINDIKIEISIINDIIKSNQKDKINNNVILNNKFILLFCANIFTTSIICLSFARIF
jgi:predicted  nucleic acid-binding Zn-ribbon protein